MNYLEKYKKYKEKYINLKNKLYGGSLTDITSNNGYILSYNIFDQYNKETPNPTSFDTMINRSDYDSALFIFNDNTRDYEKTNAGGGNASIRPYKANLRSWGIPTGYYDDSKKGQGFKNLTDLINGKTAQSYIDNAVNDIKALIWKRHNSKNPVKRIIYSGYDIKNLVIDGTNIPYLAMSIFTFSDKINEYIIKKIYELYNFMQNHTNTQFSYVDANTYEYKTAAPVYKTVAPVFQFEPKMLGNLIDGGKEHTGSINIQLKIKKNNPLYNHFLNIYNTIVTKSITEFKFNLHITLFTIIYYKDHPYIQSEIFKTNIHKLENMMQCLTDNINTNAKYTDIKNALSFKTNGFDVFGSDPDKANYFFVALLEGDNNINKIIRSTKTHLCKFLFGDNTFYASTSGTGNFIQLSDSFISDNMYYFTHDSNEALYKISKKFFSFKEDDSTYKAHISLTKLSYIKDYKKKEYDKMSKEQIEQQILSLINDKNKKLNTFNFDDNFEFDISHIQPNLTKPTKPTKTNKK